MILISILNAVRVPRLFLSLCDGVDDRLRIFRPDPLDGFSHGVVERYQDGTQLAETLLILSATYRHVALQNAFNHARLPQSHIAGNRQVQKFISNAFEVSFPLRIQVVRHFGKFSLLARKSLFQFTRRLLPSPNQSAHPLGNPL
jgi:hypothetical protein